MSQKRPYSEIALSTAAPDAWNHSVMISADYKDELFKYISHHNLCKDLATLGSAHFEIQHMKPSEEKFTGVFYLREGIYEIPFEDDILYLEARYGRAKNIYSVGRMVTDVLTFLTLNSNVSHEHICSFLRTVTHYYNSNAEKTISVMTYDCRDGWCRNTNISRRSLSTVYLPDGDIENIIADIKQFYDKKHIYARVGRPHRRNYLFFGPPGNGKTSFITAIASKFDLMIATIVLGPTMKDSELTSAMTSAPKKCALVLEDIDSILHAAGQRVLESSLLSFSTLLNVLDGHVRRDDTLVFMTTNKPEKVKGVLCRPGRVDYKLEFKNLQKPEICKMAVSMFNETPPATIDNIVSLVCSVVKKGISAASLQQFLFDILLEYGDNIGEDHIIKNLPKLKTLLSEETTRVGDDTGNNFYS